MSRREVEDNEDQCGVARKSDYCNPSSRSLQGRQTRGVNLQDDEVKGEQSGLLKRARDVKTEIYLAAYLPWVVFVTLLVLFTIWYNSKPVVPWFAVLLFTDLVIVGAYPQRVAAGYKARTRWDWFPLICGLIALGAGISLGIQNAAIVEPWMHAHYLRAYSNVNPEADPKMYVDAGVVHFATGTQLDVGSSAGHLSWPHTYCAAPIVASGGSETAARVGFWAIGVDCCSAHGDFTCNDAGNPDAKSGLRIESHYGGQPSSGSSNFDLAVNKAAAFYGKEVSEMPVYVVWQADPRKSAMHHLIGGIVFVAIFAALATCGCTCVRYKVHQVGRQRQEIDRDQMKQLKSQQGGAPPQFGTAGP